MARILAYSGVGSLTVSGAFISTLQWVYKRLIASMVLSAKTIMLTTYINSLAHIVDCEESNLDCSEKPSKNNELRKTKT
jgi:hypothetical protein